MEFGSERSEYSLEYTVPTTVVLEEGGKDVEWRLQNFQSGSDVCVKKTLSWILQERWDPMWEG